MKKCIDKSQEVYNESSKALAKMKSALPNKPAQVPVNNSVYDTIPTIAQVPGNNRPQYKDIVNDYISRMQKEGISPEDIIKMMQSQINPKPTAIHDLTEKLSVAGLDAMESSPPTSIDSQNTPEFDELNGTYNGPRPRSTTKI